MMASGCHYAYTLQFPIGKQGIELNKSYFYCWLQPLLFMITHDHFKDRQTKCVYS